MTHYTITDKIISEADAWYSNVNSATLSTKKRAEFQEWFEADPDHQQAYAQVFMCHDEQLAFSESAPQAESNRGITFIDRLKSNSSNDTGHENATEPQHVKATGFVQKLTLIAAMFGAAFLGAGLYNARTGPVSYTTQIAEVRNLILEDGTTVTLGASSHIEVADFSGNERHVTLIKGEALFDVTRDPSKHFVIAAGDIDVRVLGTKFNLNKTQNYLAVSLLEGKLDVEQHKPAGMPITSTPLEKVTLVSGQQVAVNNGELLKPKPRSAKKMANWVDGKLNYIDMPLHVVIADVNRYSRLPVRIAGKDLENLTVTAVFGVDQIGLMVEGLEHILPVLVTRSPEAGYVIRPKNTI